MVDRAALTANLDLARTLAPGAAQLCMVKANAYGHGMLQVAESLAPHCEYFGVARLAEAMDLRQHGIDPAIVLFSHLLQHEDFASCAAHNVIPVLYAQADLQSRFASCEQHALPFWLKIDTGMHRLGVNPGAAILQQVLASPLCELLLTHCHSADLQTDATRAQLQQFGEVLARHGYDARERKISVANSALLLRGDGSSSYGETMRKLIPGYVAANDVARPGIMLYGADPLQKPASNSRLLQPAMTFAAPVIDLHEIAKGETVGYGANWRAGRQSWIATVAAGYGDGYPRHARSGTPVSIGGRHCALAGRVSMDSIGVDVTDAVLSGATVQAGDTAILWGSSLPVEDIAACAATISYDLLTGITSRVERIFL